MRDLGMMVDLIFLNSEMSLQQALDDVSQGGSAFAIVITPQHQVHHSCTVNIMFGTPQGRASPGPGSVQKGKGRAGWAVAELCLRRGAKHDRQLTVCRLCW